MVVLEKGRLGWILATGRISRHKIHWRLIGCFEDLEGCTSWVSMYRDVRLRSARLISPEQNITIEDTRCASSTLRLQLSLLTDFTNDFANNAAGLILLGFGWLVHWFSLFTMHWSFFSSFSFDSLCFRFHVLSEFDEMKRSCRKRLADHNRRRRKPSAQTAPIKEHQTNQICCSMCKSPSFIFELVSHQSHIYIHTNIIFLFRLHGCAEATVITNSASTGDSYMNISSPAAAYFHHQQQQQHQNRKFFINGVASGVGSTSDFPMDLVWSSYIYVCV